MSMSDEIIVDSLDRIERKLDDIAGKVNRHEGAISILLWLGPAVAGLISIVLGFLGIGSKH